MISTYINGIKIYEFINKDELINFSIEKKAILIAINAEKILHSNDTTRKIINANIGYTDGVGAVWAMRKHGFKNAIKIPGCELWLEIIARYFKEKSFYLVGSKPEVIKQTIKKLNEKFPQIRILNYRDGYINSFQEKKNLLEDIKTKAPDVVFIALGSPKQEQLMKEMLDFYPALYMGLGGSFDLIAGYTKRAPEFWLNLQLEWLYRLLSQPFRIRRQFHLIRFAFLIIFGRI